MGELLFPCEAGHILPALKSHFMNHPDDKTAHHRQRNEPTAAFWRFVLVIGRAVDPFVRMLSANCLARSPPAKLAL